MARTQEEILKLVRLTPFMWPDSIIHMFESGSALHGATGDKPTDTDVSGVYIQPVEMILGISMKSFDPDVQVWSSAGDHEKNTADDIDVNMYSLRKWATMAATGNTTALEFLFAKPEYREATAWHIHIVPNTEHFISARAGFHFAEFAKSMLKRLKGEGTGKHGQRPELEEQFGYDVKAAMHLLRVLGEGIELMDQGRITLPRPEAPFLKDVRRGKFTWEEIEEIANARFEVLAIHQAKSFLPPELDRTKISRIITDAQLEFWGL